MERQGIADGSSPKSKKQSSGSLRPGQALRIFFNPGNLNNRTIHIRAIVDGEWIVYKTWIKEKARWHYQVDHRVLFDVYFEKGRISPAR